MGAMAGAECCVDEYDDQKKEDDRKQALVDQLEYENKLEEESRTRTPNGINSIPSRSNYTNTVPLKLPNVDNIAPWDTNSKYHSQLSYMEMSSKYEHYRKPPNFYDDCIRKLRSTKKNYKSTQKQAQYDAIIQNTSKAVKRISCTLINCYGLNKHIMNNSFSEQGQC